MSTRRAILTVTTTIVITVFLFMQMVSGSNEMPASSTPTPRLEKYYAGNDLKYENNYTSHAPISIMGEGGFTAENGVISGSGTEEDPYIIGGWEIEVSALVGIHIQDTNKSFIIQNCKIHGRDGSIGIRFQNVHDGKINNTAIVNHTTGVEIFSSDSNVITGCVIRGIVWKGQYMPHIRTFGISLFSASNNQIREGIICNNSFGICLDNASNNSVGECVIYNNTYGIYLYSSPSNYLANNTIYNNSKGLYLCSSNGNGVMRSLIYGNIKGAHLLGAMNNIIQESFIHNNSKYGLLLEVSSYNTFRFNKLEGNLHNFGIENWGIENLSYFHNNIDTTNTINNKPIYYIMNQTDVVLDSNVSVGYVGLISCENITIKNLTLSNNFQSLLLVNTNFSNIISCKIRNNGFFGIELFLSSNNTISYCSVNNSREGISLRNSSYTNIKYCSVHNNWYGVYIGYSSNNTITSCDIYNNGFGIFLSFSEANRFYSNNFINNSRHAYDEYFNSWDNGARGNYWDDYNGTDYDGDGIGDQPYFVSGYGSKDGYPYTSPVRDRTPPEISDIQATAATEVEGNYVNITCRIMDNAAVEVAILAITGPMGFIPLSITMTKIPDTDNYYFNSSYLIAGEYSYYIWARDTNGNEANSVKYYFAVPIKVTTTVGSKEVSIIGRGNGTINITLATPPKTPPKNLKSVACINVTITGELTYANITIKYNERDVVDIDELKLRMYYWDEIENEWVLCNNTGVDAKNNIVWANVTHLTIFAPMAEKISAPPIWMLYAGIMAVIVILAVSLAVAVKKRKKLERVKL